MLCFTGRTLGSEATTCSNSDIITCLTLQVLCHWATTAGHPSQSSICTADLFEVWNLAHFIKLFQRSLGATCERHIKCLLIQNCHAIVKIAIELWSDKEDCCGPCFKNVTCATHMHSDYFRGHPNVLNKDTWMPSFTLNLTVAESQFSAQKIFMVWIFVFWSSTRNTQILYHKIFHTTYSFFNPNCMISELIFGHLM